jgi:hypothetical protein
MFGMSDTRESINSRYGEEEEDIAAAIGKIPQNGQVAGKRREERGVYSALS